MTPRSAGCPDWAQDRSDVQPSEAATRSEFAATVRAGFTAPDDGKTEASTTHRFVTSCARQCLSTTLVAGSSPILAVPH